MFFAFSLSASSKTVIQHHRLSNLIFFLFPLAVSKTEHPCHIFPFIDRKVYYIVRDCRKKSRFFSPFSFGRWRSDKKGHDPVSLFRFSMTKDWCVLFTTLALFKCWIYSSCPVVKHNSERENTIESFSNTRSTANHHHHRHTNPLKWFSFFFFPLKAKNCCSL